VISGQDIRVFETGHWIYSAQELKQMLLSCNFVDIEIYGNLAGGAYDDMAQRMVVQAHKNMPK
jgi:hypothetical protein